MSKITYIDKVAITTDPTIATVNKIRASDMNEIKDVVNSNAEQFDNFVKNIDNLIEDKVADILDDVEVELIIAEI